MKLHKLFSVLAFGLLSFTACADEINIAVASNFSTAMHAIAAAFEKESGHRAIPAFGSSGKLYTQIRNGAPFKVFISADEASPLALEKEGLVVTGTRFTYAIGTMALWSSRPGFVDQEAQVLKQGRFNKIAIANPRHAPYGQAAIEVLRHLSIAEPVHAKLVLGENIAQTYQFVATGNAELGFVALSQIMDKGEITQGSAWMVPAGMHNPIRQDAVLLKSGVESKAAQELIRFLRSEHAQLIIVSYGYQTAVD